MNQKLFFFSILFFTLSLQACQQDLSKQQLESTPLIDNGKKVPNENSDLKSVITNLLDSWNSDEKNSHKYPSVDGIRNLYWNETENLGFKLIGDLVGEAVFSKGPHKKEMNFDANTIGYYNPKFLKSLEKQLKEIFKDKVWVDKYREVYYNSVYHYLHELRMAYRYIEKNEEKVKKAIADFEEGRNITVNIEGVSTSSLEDIFFRQRLNFWARRHMDGTADQFKKLLYLVTDAFEIHKMQLNPFVIGILPDFAAGCYYVPINFKKANTDDSYWIEGTNHTGILVEDTHTEIIVEKGDKYKVEVFERTIYRNAISFHTEGGLYFDGNNVESIGNYCTKWEKLDPYSQNSFRLKNDYIFWGDRDKALLEACPVQATVTKDQLNQYFLKSLREHDRYKTFSENILKEKIESQGITKRAVQVQVRYVENGEPQVITYTFFVEMGEC